MILSESRRFDNRIARLANTVAVSEEQMYGTKNDFSDRECCHTIYLFSTGKAGQVVDAFGQLVLDTFSDEELLKNKKSGCHVVGMVHVKKADTPGKQFPKGMYDYWKNYEAKKSSRSQNPDRMIDYIRIGHFEFEANGELFALVEWTAKGVLKQ